jgi:hypothetical protein
MYKGQAGIGNGDIEVLIAFVWVLSGIPVFVVLGISFAFTIITSFMLKDKHVPYVSLLAISLCLSLPLILTGALR